MRMVQYKLGCKKKFFFKCYGAFYKKNVVNTKEDTQATLFSLFLVKAYAIVTLSKDYYS